MTDFHNKNILITGASKGLGAVCAREFARLGARLALVARSRDLLDEVRESCERKEEHICIVADFLNHEATEAVKKAVTFIGEIDIAIHSAGGGLGLRDPILNVEDFDKLLTLNLKSCVEINKVLLPKMMERKLGNIVHIGSIASTQAIGSVGYNTSKAALAAYVRSLGREIAASGVVITGILPGGFIAPGNAMERLQKNNLEAYNKFINERMPRKRMALAEEILPVILMLSSSEASMMGGCMVPIDAGEGLDYTA